MTTHHEPDTADVPLSPRGSSPEKHGSPAGNPIRPDEEDMITKPRAAAMAKAIARLVEENEALREDNRRLFDELETALRSRRDSDEAIR